MSVSLYRAAAVQGHGLGQRNLAYAYQTGSGVEVDLIKAYAWFNLASANEEAGQKAGVARDELAKQMSKAQITEAQRLSREWKAGGDLGKSSLKPAKPAAAPARPRQASADASPYPARPQARPGVTTCNMNCNNGDCYRTYDTGRKARFQAPRKFDPFTSQWTWDAGTC